MINLAIIGYGYWGPNLLRNFSQFDGCRVKTVADLSSSRLRLAKRSHPSLKTTQDAREIFRDPSIDAVVIATPISTHYDLAAQALTARKHVLVEKPLTSSSRSLRSLMALAKRSQRVLMTDYTFLYTGAVKKIKELVDYGQIGDFQYFDSTRINLGLFQHDVNVVWDLAPHDIAILLYLFGDRPTSVMATGISHTDNGIENIAYITLYFSARRIAHFHCSWASPVKIRKILIGGSKKMVVFDDIEPTEKVKVYDSGYSFNKDEAFKILVDYRRGDVFAPKLELKEALYGVAEDFLSAIVTGREPASHAGFALSVMEILEAAARSMKLHKEVAL